MENHGIEFLNFCGNPEVDSKSKTVRLQHPTFFVAKTIRKKIIFQI